MSSSVQAGKLIRISPSSISTFDATSRFGCERKWYFEYVLGYRSPSTGAQVVGTKLHASNEEYIDKGTIEGEVGELFTLGKSYIDSIRPNIVETEKEISFEYEGVKGVGYVDVILKDGILDWKTTADINKYGKTGEDLRKDVQMVIYAKAVHPTLKQMRLVHGQYQTSGRKQFRAVETIISREAIEVVEESVIVPLVQKMKVAAGLKNVVELPPSPNKCYSCAHKSLCPQSESENALLKFLSITKKPEVAAPVAEDAKPTAPDSPKASIAAGQVLPPDAPKSDPAKAAEPVEGFAAVPAPKTEEEKKGRGRPKGSKNKMRIEVDEPAASAPAVVLPEQPIQQVIVPNEVSKVAPKLSPLVTEGLEYTKIRVVRSVTIQPVQFNPIRFEVELEAYVNGLDLNTAYGQMSTEAQRLVQTDAEVFMENFRAKTGVK